MSFSWRLVFAPAEVLDYLVAHEVAHLVHMNHGPRFWALADACRRSRWRRRRPGSSPTANNCCSTGPSIPEINVFDAVDWIDRFADLLESEL